MQLMTPKVLTCGIVFRQGRPVIVETGSPNTCYITLPLLFERASLKISHQHGQQSTWAVLRLQLTVRPPRPQSSQL